MRFLMLTRPLNKHIVVHWRKCELFWKDKFGAAATILMSVRRESTVQRSVGLLQVMNDFGAVDERKGVRRTRRQNSSSVTVLS